MELVKLIKDYDIIGIVSNYQININEGYVKDLNIPNINKALIMLELNEDILNKKISELTISELFKVDLMSKLNNKIIIVGNLSKYLIYKDINYIKKLLKKLNNNYNKKIVVIDEDISVFFDLVKYIYVIKNKKLIYQTDEFFDNKLYDYVKCPKIIDFINFVNKNEIRLDNNIDIHELIKDIYRRLS